MRSARALLAVIVVFVVEDLHHVGLIAATIAVGAIVGAVVSRRVAMTQMPQLVAIFNGVGGGAAALIEFSDSNSRSTMTAALFTMVIGGISFAGSAVTFLKMQELITGRPITFPGGPYLFGLLMAADLSACAWAYHQQLQHSSGLAAGVVVLVSLVVGVLFVLPWAAPTYPSSSRC